MKKKEIQTKKENIPNTDPVLTCLTISPFKPPRFCVLVRVVPENGLAGASQRSARCWKGVLRSRFGRWTESKRPAEAVGRMRKRERRMGERSAMFLVLLGGA